MKSTKIVCTLGPASREPEMIGKLLKAGMDVARMNMSHGSHDYHLETIKNVREESEKAGKYTGLLLDLQGPKIRTGRQSKEIIELKTGSTIKLTSEDIEGNWEILSVNYPGLQEETSPGERILLDDGNIELKVTGKDKVNVFCKVINGGRIRAFRGINLPETPISTPSLTEKDLEDLEFGLKNRVDFVALSFVRKAEDIVRLREITEKAESPPFLIAKIEKPEAVAAIDDIIREADGIMIARGDLGAETSPQEVPILQKRIIRKCNLAGKPVITATQMMESMIGSPRPTRAEANDVANAIYDGTDAVMLSGETAMGSYPEETVSVMASIAERTEQEINYTKITESIYMSSGKAEDHSDAVCYSACMLCDTINTNFMMGFSVSGRTLKSLSKYRPSRPIIGMSPDSSVLRKLSVYRGITGIRIDFADSSEALFDNADRILSKYGLCSPGEKVIAVSSMPLTGETRTNMIKIHTVG